MLGITENRTRTTGVEGRESLDHAMVTDITIVLTYIIFSLNFCYYDISSHTVVLIS